MKENWERVKVKPSIPVEEITEKVREETGREVLMIEELTGGLSHSNYKLQFHKSPPLVIRVTSNKDRLTMERQLHSLLRDVPEVPSFFTIFQIGENWAGLMEWKEGKQLKHLFYQGDNQSNERLGYSAGELLARFRNISFENSGFFDAALKVEEPFHLEAESYRQLLESFLQDKVKLWIGPELQSRIISYASRQVELLKLDDSGPALVHGDFNGLNLLGDTNSVTAVLDWEFAFSGSIYVDIGNFIRYENFPEYQACERGLISGLRDSGIYLPEEWKEIARLVDLLGLCSMLNLEHPAPNRFKDLNRLIEQTIYA
ncbi:aminoglycoside phosphotransferase family protein [Halobacillus salinarum]|uniref:Aminoglycoside phosphotransferase family protein n=1 Tax=Halobacillus salinarum TaxID=2932257 RepID=A0ABY4EH61_9BACI|nr:aminoglycoside phosphotransferase family protein [Halobacillus salinarum]UOQ43808.1 aminoglycoside phosphotransferase family protein [Halobacillus salinarum]